MAELIDIIISVILAIATGLAALAAFLSWNASNQHLKTIVRPVILVYPSEQRHRVHLADQHELDPNQIHIPGIRVDNVGLGPAIRGIIYLVQGQTEIAILELNERYTFQRIPAGQPFFYPSHDSPTLQNHLTATTTSIRIRVVYYDVLGNRYTFPSEAYGYSEEIRF